MDIKIESLYFGYDGNCILKDINLEFKNGNMYALLGRNGSGKTTLIKLILGLLNFNQGVITLDGKDIKSITIRDLSKLIAYVPQSEEGSYDIKVIELVVMGRNPYLNLFDIPSGEDYKLAEQALESLGIKHLSQKAYFQISGGEKQLTLIARALVQNTKFIIMDEPISNLDIKNQHEVLNKIKNISQELSIGVVLSLHDANLAERYCSEAVLLKKGEIISQGKTHEVLCEGSLENIYETSFEILKSKEGFNYFISSRYNSDR